MATERQLQFQVGSLALIAVSVCIALVIRFGDTHSLLKKRYPLTVQLENSGGLYPTAPVTLSGLNIGTVRKVELNRSKGGVNIHVEIDRDIQLPADSRAIVTRSLLGEAAIEFIAGTDANMIEAGGDVTGATAADPLVMIQRLEARTMESLNAFSGTSQEWKHVAENINTLLDTKRGHLDEVVENAADALHEFTIAVKNTNRLIETANKIVGDPKAQQAVKDTLVSLPKLVVTIRTTLEETQQVMDGMNRNLVNLTGVTEPMGKRGTQIVSKLESTLGNVDQLSTELSRFVRTVNQKEGTLQQLVSNPSLYNNLDRSSQSMVILLKHMEPVMKDLREFSDKVARNPELLGLGGAVRPSRGLKDEEILDAKRTNPGKMPNARGKAPQ